jgi:hypothetical protein
MIIVIALLEFYKVMFIMINTIGLVNWWPILNYCPNPPKLKICLCVKMMNMLYLISKCICYLDNDVFIYIGETTNTFIC